MRFAPLALLALTACASSWPAAKTAFADAEDARVRFPKDAPEKFAEARSYAASALRERLDPHVKAACASVHLRCIIELGEFAAAEKAIDDFHGVFEGYDSTKRREGDLVGLALLQSAWLRRKAPGGEEGNIDRAIDLYDDARVLAFGRPARGLLDRHYVDALLKKGSPETVRRAVRICEEHIDRMEPLEPYFRAILKQIQK
jgi:hypothetical protein